LKGTRPSAYRIRKYGLEQYLGEDVNVLDIGCNSGFLDMSIATRVKTITGVEYDKTLVEIADCVKDWLHMDNCSFVNGDFNEWYKTNETCFGLIFSFAIHHWLNIRPEEYADRLDKLLKKGGYVCIESHELNWRADEEYTACVDILRDRGYVAAAVGDIMDDGVTRRNYCILQKSR
jgi:trans-aconitate methyltransferase